MRSAQKGGNAHLDAGLPDVNGDDFPHGGLGGWRVRELDAKGAAGP